MITYHSDDTVTVRGYSAKPVTLSFRAWLNTTDRAVMTAEAALQRGVKTDAEATAGELLAKRWLAATFASTSKMSAVIASYKARRSLFDIPPDPSRIIRCRCCNIPLRDPVSKLLGIGPVCRNPNKAAKAAV